MSSAQQRYFSYRALPVAIVSQNSFVLVFMAYRTIIARYVAKCGIAEMCLCETKYPEGSIAPFWGSANLPAKVSRNMGYRSDSIAISRDMAPLSELRSEIPFSSANFRAKSHFQIVPLKLRCPPLGPPDLGGVVGLGALS